MIVSLSSLSLSVRVLHWLSLVCSGELIKAVYADESSVGELLRPYLEAGQQGMCQHTHICTHTHTDRQTHTLTHAYTHKHTVKECARAVGWSDFRDG